MVKPEDCDNTNEIISSYNAFVVYSSTIYWYWYKRSAIVLSTLTYSRQRILLIYAPNIILWSTLYLLCVYEFNKCKSKHGSKKFRIFNEKRTDSTETALFKKYDGESLKLYHKIKMESTFCWLKETVGKQYELWI